MVFNSENFQTSFSYPDSLYYFPEFVICQLSAGFAVTTSTNLIDVVVRIGYSVCSHQSSLVMVDNHGWQMTIFYSGSFQTSSGHFSLEHCLFWVLTPSLLSVLSADTAMDEFTCQIWNLLKCCKHWLCPTSVPYGTVNLSCTLSGKSINPIRGTRDLKLKLERQSIHKKTESKDLTDFIVFGRSPSRGSATSPSSRPSASCSSSPSARAPSRGWSRPSCSPPARVRLPCRSLCSSTGSPTSSWALACLRWSSCSATSRLFRFQSSLRSSGPSRIGWFLRLVGRHTSRLQLVSSARDIQTGLYLPIIHLHGHHSITVKAPNFGPHGNFWLFLQAL